ncbi:MAG: HipA domain-containing protein [Acidimicrobiales bacterium]|nr:HipA domain-containing protein [Acidimicrobiales bacterium]
MTSERAPDRGYVWAWLQGATEPVPAGVIETQGDGDGAVLTFAYGRRYLDRDDAWSPYQPELPLKPGRQVPGENIENGSFLTCHGVIRDAAPDAWGQRVIMRRLQGRADRDTDLGDLPLLTYLLEAGSDGPGALDVQASPDVFVDDTATASLEDLLEAADRIQAGGPIPAALEPAMAGGSSLGGARPKAALVDGARSLIAKFPKVDDLYPVVGAEAVAMDLAGRVGLDVAPTELVEVGGRSVLLVERFDRPGGGIRRQFVSASTVLGLDEIAGRYATYVDVAEKLRTRSPDRAEELRELFGRIVFNVLVSNTDDHARNHAMFCDRDELVLTPAYDICPQMRTGQVTEQAMAFGPSGAKSSRLATCVASAATYDLSETEAREIVDHQVAVVRSEFADVADRARLTEPERDFLWGRQFCNPYAFEAD